MHGTTRRSAIDAAFVETLLSYGLPIVTLVMFASAAGIPTGVPIKVVLLLAGAYLISSLPVLLLAILVLAAAELGGTMLLHGIARTGGVRLLDRIASDRRERVQATLNRWRVRLGGREVAAIAVLRLIPFVRMGTTVGTGLIGIRLRDFVLGSTVAALIWVSVPLSIGYAFRSNLETLEAYYATAVSALPVLLGISSLTLVAGVLFKSTATRGWIRESLAHVFPRFRTAASLPIPEITQETPPVI